jgi:type I restriction enzyme R subunit
MTTLRLDRVVAVEMNPKATQGDLIAAVGPVADRIVKRYKAARERLLTAKEHKDEKAAQEAQDELNTLILFKRDIATYQRVYAFLSQIFDYGSTAIEKRAIFFRKLIPLLEFGREREGIDLSKLKLTHHGLKNQGQAEPTAGGRGEGAPSAAYGDRLRRCAREGEGASPAQSSGGEDNGQQGEGG